MSSPPEKQPGKQRKPSPSDPWQAETPERAPKPTWRERFVRLLPLLAVMTLALIVRGGVLWKMGDNLRSDPDGYLRVAEKLFQYGEYRSPNSRAGVDSDPSAYRPPLYPLLLSKVAVDEVITRVNVARLHLALGVATVALVYVVSVRWQLGRWGIAAAILVACDPILLQQSTLVMTETLAAFLAVISLYLLSCMSGSGRPWHAMLAGGALGLAVLCRPTFLVWLIVCVFVAALLQGTRTRRLWRATALVVGASVVISPWAIRNWIVLGSPIVTTTHGGYTLALANNPELYKHLRSGKPLGGWNADEFTQPFHWRSVPWDYAQLWETRYIERHGHPPGFDWRERAYDAGHYDLAFRTIRDDPAMFAYSCVLRVGQLWSPLPHRPQNYAEGHASAGLRYAVAVWYIGVYALALGGVVRLRWKILQTPWLWGVLLVASFTLVHTFYWTNLRMRAPLMPFVCLLAAVGAAYLWDLLARRKRLPGSELAPTG